MMYLQVRTTHLLLSIQECIPVRSWWSKSYLPAVGYRLSLSKSAGLSILQSMERTKLHQASHLSRVEAANGCATVDPTSPMKGILFSTVPVFLSKILTQSPPRSTP